MSKSNNYHLCEAVMRLRRTSNFFLEKYFCKTSFRKRSFTKAVGTSVIYSGAISMSKNNLVNIYKENIYSCVGIRKQESLRSYVEVNLVKINKIKIARYISYYSKYTCDD